MVHEHSSLWINPRSNLAKDSADSDCQDIFDEVQLFHCWHWWLCPGGPRTCGFLVKYTTCRQDGHLLVACSTRESKVLWTKWEMWNWICADCGAVGGDSPQSHCIPADVEPHKYRHNNTPRTPEAEHGHLSDSSPHLCCIWRLYAAFIPNEYSWELGRRVKQGYSARIFRSALFRSIWRCESLWGRRDELRWCFQCISVGVSIQPLH